MGEGEEAAIAPLGITHLFGAHVGDEKKMRRREQKTLQGNKTFAETESRGQR